MKRICLLVVLVVLVSGFVLAVDEPSVGVGGEDVEGGC
jgi:hypothetical protein